MRINLPIVFAGVIIGSTLIGAENTLPALKAERWVNSAPLSSRGLRGKVVLVDFWEYTCINWIRTLPFIKAWNRDYAALGLVVVGVHAPEFEFGKQRREHRPWDSRSRADLSDRDRQPVRDLAGPGQ